MQSTSRAQVLEPWHQDATGTVYDFSRVVNWQGSFRNLMDRTINDRNVASFEEILGFTIEYASRTKDDSVLHSNSIE